MYNPFPYEKLATLDSFYGRDEEIRKLTLHVETSTNVLLFSKRRMGKSTLIKNLFSKLEKDYIVIYMDVFNIITAEDFAKLLLKAIANAQKGDITKSIKWLTSFFKRTRVEPTFDINTGKMGMKPVVTDVSFEDMIEDVFNALFEMSKTKNVAFAIDEFQQISTIKNKRIDALIRKYMQEPYNISYIFAGSKKHTLNEFFMYKSPLFEMATPLGLESISQDDIYEYAKKHLEISKEMVSHIYDLADGETKLIQALLHKAYLEEKEVDETIINTALEDILISKNDHCRAVFEMLSTNQKKAFKALARYKKMLLSHDILMEANISRASMQSSLKQLFEKELIDKENDVWFIPDRTLELWAKSL